MAHHYDASFAPSPLPLMDVLAGIELTFQSYSIEFSGEIYQLSDQGGRLGVETGFSEHVTNMSTAASRASRWAGASLCGISRTLWEELGPGDAAEVFFRIKRHDDRAYSLTYNEHREAFHARVSDEELARELCGMLLHICKTIESHVCIYDEEPLSTPIAPSIRTVEDILAKRRFSSGGADGVLVFRADALDMAMIRGRFAAGVQLMESTTGLVALNFLQINL